MQATLVGRGDERARLVELLDAAVDRRGGFAFVTGDAGIGKTALVTACTISAGEAGFAVAVGPCSPGGAGRLPFAPWIEILAELDRLVIELAVAVPEGVRRAVATLLRPWEAAADGFGGSAALFAAVTEFVLRVADARPLLLVIEDVHWSDASSVDLLAHLARRAPRSRLAVVATSRPVGATGPDHLHELGRASTLLLPLAPLTDHDIAALVHDAVSSAPAVDPAAAARIVRLAEGNPFLALHLVRRSTGAQGNDDADVLGVRRAVADADAAGLLLRLALGPDDLPDDVLAVATGLEVGRRVLVTRALVDHGLLVIARGRLRFRHALLREEVTALATPAETVTAHADLADAMTASTDDAGAAALAHHQLAAGRWDDALRSLLRAADHADRVHAHREAQDALSTVREVWPRASDPVAIVGFPHGELLMRLGRTARTRGDFAVAHAVWEDVEHASHDAATLAFERALTHFYEGEEATAVEGFERADTALVPSAALPRGRVLAALARALLTCYRADDAARVAATALDVSDDPVVRIDARITRVGAGRMSGAPAGPGATELRRCAREARDLGAVDLMLRSYGGLLNFAHEAARFTDTLEIVDDVVRACARFGPAPTMTSIVAPFQVDALIALGRWDEASRTAAAAVHDAGFRDIAAVLHVQIALVAARRGDWPEVERRLHLAVPTRADEPVLVAMLFEVRTTLALHRGDVRAALDDVRTTVDSWSGDTAQLTVSRLLRTAWRVLAAQTSRPTDLVAALDRLADDVGAVADDRRPRWWVEHEHARAERARALHDPTEPARWATIAGSLRKLGWRDELPGTLWRQADALARRRQVVEAGRVAHEARAAATEIGATVVLGEVDRLLALLGDPPPPTLAPTAPVRPMGLTAREMQVLGLLQTGATNRAIARTLFISERTAGVHVSNIIGEFGVTNRTQAAQLGNRLTAADDGPADLRRHDPHI